MHEELLRVSVRAMLACALLGIGGAVIALDYVQTAALSSAMLIGIAAVAFILTSGMAISLYMVLRLAKLLIKNAKRG